LARLHDDRDDEGDLDESEDPEPDTDDAELTEECPHCGKPIYEDSGRCPHCENYLSREDAPPRRPLWVIIGVVLALAVALLWALGG
jgi:hypothetical protein